MKLNKVVEQIQKLEQAIQTPWEVHRTGIKLSLSGSQISLTKDDDSDFVNIEEARTVASWLVEQLGGKVRWPK